MKTITILFTLGMLAPTCYPEESTATQPKQLLSLRETYQAAVAKATDPLKRTYLTELQKLKLQFTKAGDLESALAVDSEIRTLGEKTDNAIKASDVNTKREFRQAVMGGKWSMKRVADGKPWGVWEFNDDGTVVVAERPRKWNVTDRRIVLVDGMFKATFSDDLQSFEVHWGETGDLKGEIENPAK